MVLQLGDKFQFAGLLKINSGHELVIGGLWRVLTVWTPHICDGDKVRRAWGVGGYIVVILMVQSVTEISRQCSLEW